LIGPKEPFGLILGENEMTVQTHELKEAADHLHKAAELLYPEISYTTIELLAAFSRGIATITEPVSQRKLLARKPKGQSGK
jgi:hypothetical protein